MTAACSDPNNKIALTHDGWNDLKIGGPIASLDPHIDADTITYQFDGCTSVQILQDAPRAMSVIVDNRAGTIAQISIGGVAKVETHQGLGLDHSLDEVREALQESHTFIPIAECTGSAVKCANNGDLAIDWAKGAMPAGPDDFARGMRFRNWRSNEALHSIAVGDYKPNGDGVCD